LSQEKRDTGNLTGENRKPNEGRYGKGLRVFAIPGLVGMMVTGSLLAWTALSEEGPAPPKNDLPPPNAALPDFPSDAYTPKPQATSGATSEPPPVPPEIKAVIDKLEADNRRRNAEEAAASEGSNGVGSGTRTRPRVRVISDISISRPPDSGTGGSTTATGTQMASTDGGYGTGGDGASSGGVGDGTRRGGVFSQNRLEKNYQCQASAGQPIALKLPEGFNTEQEGDISAMVTTDSYSRDRKCLTIPEGSWFHGQYKIEVARGQKRASLTFTSIERPPPASDTIMLDGAKAYERDGRAGLIGEVNSNIPWGMIIASTVIDLGTAYLSGLDEGNGTDINIGGTVANNTGSVLRDVARDRYEKAPASIDVEPKAILVRLNKHLPMTPFPKS
jgi:type IV secretory pathway VirB10-like protein